MYRIIYLTDHLVYKNFESDNYNTIADQHMHLKKCGCKIICLIDYKSNVILNRCPDYMSHIQEINKYVYNNR
jgi:hypothetical protein